MTVFLILAGVAFAVLGLAGIIVHFASRRARAKAEEAAVQKARDLIDRRAAGAAPALIAAGRLQEALDLLISVGDFKGAARVAVRMQLPARAAELFERGRDYESAANTLLKIPDFRRAAQCFARAGNRDRAAEVFIQIGDLWAAAEELVAGGRLQAAAKVYRELGNDNQAALLEAQALRVAGNLLGAAEAFSAARAPARAAECLAEAGRPKEAARELVKAGQPDKAAALMEKTGALAEAAELYDEAGDHAAAARMYAKLQNPDGELQALVAAGEVLAAGHLAYKLGRKTTAEEILRTAKNQDRGYARSCLLLGRILEETGRIGEALVHYRLFIERGTPTDQTRTVFEYLHGLFLRNGDKVSARRTLKHLEDAGQLSNDLFLVLRRLEDDDTARSTAAPSPEAPAAAPPPVPPPPPPYHPIPRLGEGGTAVVWLAKDQTLKRDVVLKFLQNPALPPDLAEDYFLREAQIVAGMSHPSIVQVYDVGSHAGRQFMVLEYLQGETLDQLLRRTPGNVLPITRVATMATELAAALAYAHERRIIHRDLKPSNVMILPDGHAKLMDFGMAKALEVHTDRSLYICGTPEYMSPEQEAGADVTAASDIYSFALVLAEALLGRLPVGAGPQQTRHARMGFVEAGNLPDDVRRVLIRCLALDPQSRPASALVLSEALRRGAGMTGPVARPVP